MSPCTEIQMGVSTIPRGNVWVHRRRPTGNQIPLVLLGLKRQNERSNRRFGTI